MQGIFDREERIIGEERLERLKNSKVAVFGVGGVGSYAAEGLIRSGVGQLILIDKDTVDQTNINRQLFALHSTIGQVKVAAAAARLKDINPQAKIQTRQETLLPENIENFELKSCDYVVDAIDMVTSKLALAEY